MWVFTDTGFVSAVHNTRSGKIAVRARDRESLNYFVDKYGSEVLTFEPADYPYRVLLTPDQFAAWLVQSAKSIDYTNFKNRVAESRGKHYAEALNEVWGAMLEVEDAEARERSPWMPV